MHSAVDLWPHKDFVGENWLEEKANCCLKRSNCNGGNVRSFYCLLCLLVKICDAQQLIFRLKGRKINRKHLNKDRQDPRWSRPTFSLSSYPFISTKCFLIPSLATLLWQGSRKSSDILSIEREMRIRGLVTCLSRTRPQIQFFWSLVQGVCSRMFYAASQPGFLSTCNIILVMTEFWSRLLKVFPIVSMYCDFPLNFWSKK